MVKRVTKEDRRRAEERLAGVNRPASTKTTTKRGYRGSIKKLQRSANHLDSSLSFLSMGLLNTELMGTPEIEEIKKAITAQKSAIYEIKHKLEELDKVKKDPKKKKNSNYDDLKLENDELISEGD